MKNSFTNLTLMLKVSYLSFEFKVAASSKFRSETSLSLGDWWYLGARSTTLNQIRSRPKVTAARSFTKFKFEEAILRPYELALSDPCVKCIIYIGETVSFILRRTYL